jgi:hypothetical protein
LPVFGMNCSMNWRLCSNWSDKSHGLNIPIEKLGEKKMIPGLRQNSILKFRLFEPNIFWFSPEQYLTHAKYKMCAQILRYCITHIFSRKFYTTYCYYSGVKKSWLQQRYNVNSTFAGNEGQCRLDIFLLLKFLDFCINCFNFWSISWFDFFFH